MVTCQRNAQIKLMDLGQASLAGRAQTAAIAAESLRLYRRFFSLVESLRKASLSSPAPLWRRPIKPELFRVLT
jgi:hypothetical protein